jgi:hypothetical protein
MQKLHFITFANTNYMVPSRILEQASSFELFDSIKWYTEKDIPEYIEKHSNFIKEYPLGFGYYIWKPKIIMDKLNEIEENDILLYCDAGCHLNKEGKSRFLEYLDLLKSKEILGFQTTDFYKGYQVVKNDAIMSYYPEFHNKQYTAIYAGIVFLRKTKQTLQFCKEWLDLCENYHFIDASPSIIHPEVNGFVGNNQDNGLFILCMAKYESIVEYIPAEESNIYKQTGEQFYPEPNSEVWSFLDKYPIQYRRDRPHRD